MLGFSESACNVHSGTELCLVFKHLSLHAQPTSSCWFPSGSKCCKKPTALLMWNFTISKSPILQRLTRFLKCLLNVTVRELNQPHILVFVLLFDLFSFGSKENKLKEKLGETFPLLGFSLVTVVEDGGGGLSLEVLHLILTKSGTTDTLAVIQRKQHLESQERMRLSCHGLHHDTLSSETPQCYNLPRGLPLCTMATVEDIRIPCVESILSIWEVFQEELEWCIEWGLRLLLTLVMCKTKHPWLMLVPMQSALVFHVIIFVFFISYARLNWSLI